LCNLVTATSARFKAKKRALNALDLMTFFSARANLLARSDDVQRFYHEQFEAVLVDEFQDTDEVQVEIIQLLAPDGSWLSEIRSSRSIDSGARVSPFSFACSSRS